MANKITLPIVHLNGTIARDLTEGYWHAAVAVSDALAAIGKIEFNSRDYYPVDGAWDAASHEMACRVTQLRNMQRDFEKIAEHCSQFIKP